MPGDFALYESVIDLRPVKPSRLVSCRTSSGSMRGEITICPRHSGSRRTSADTNSFDGWRRSSLNPTPKNSAVVWLPGVIHSIRRRNSARVATLGPWIAPSPRPQCQVS